MKSKKSIIMAVCLITAVLAVASPVMAAEQIYFSCTAWVDCFGQYISCTVTCIGTAAGCGFSLGDNECWVWCWCDGQGSVGGGDI